MKRQLLMDFLGNFDDWIYTGWMISNADGATDGDTEIQFGKHAGTQLRGLKEGNSSYWKWLEQQAETNSRLAYIKYV
jgi:hypothetical protein